MRKLSFIFSLSIIGLLTFSACGGEDYEQYTQSEHQLEEEQEPGIHYEKDEAERPNNEGPPIEDIDTAVTGEPSEQGFAGAENNRKDEALEKEYISEDSAKELTQ